jgi:leucyl-tRNA synthetase
MKQVAQNSPKIKAQIEGKTIVKIIVVPRKLVNIVVK